MSTPKGYTSQEKEDRLSAQHVTVSRQGENKVALDVRNVGTVTEAATDAVEAGSTTTQIVATAHTMRVGDIVRFTSGALDGIEAGVWSIVDANTVELDRTLSAAPSPADTFSILRPVSLTLTSSGGFAAVNTFIRDGSNQEVTEDTVTPANNRPLPVKLVDLTGDITVTANELNINLDHANDSVEIRQTTHDNVNLNANIQVGDADVAIGNPVPISDAGGSITIDNANLDAGLSTLATEVTAAAILADTASMDTNLATVAGDTTSLDTKLPAQGAALTAASLPVNIASDQVVPVSDGGGSLTIDNSNLDAALSTLATESTLSTIQGDTTSLDTKVPAQGAAATAASLPVNIASDQTVPISAASLPLPTGAATEATLSNLDGTATSILADTANIDTNMATVAGAVSGTEMQVDIVASLPAGTNNIGDVDIASSLPAGSNTIGFVSINTLNVIAFMDTPLLDASSTNIPASASLPLQVVASLGGNVRKIQVFDTTGGFFGIYTGAAASESLVAVVGPGSNETVEVDILAGTRISLRALENTAISIGNVTMNFMG